MNKDAIRQGYNKVADEYLKNRGAFTNKQYLDKLIQLLPPRSSILDIGCGAGVPIDTYLLENGFKVKGIDISDRQVELAKEHNPQGEYDRKDMSDIEEGEFQVDAVISFYAIFHIPRETHLELFKKIRTFLPDNGYLLVTMGNSDWEGTEDFHGSDISWSHYNAEKSKSIIQEAGFKIVFDEIDSSGGEKHLVVLAQKDE